MTDDDGSQTDLRPDDSTPADAPVVILVHPQLAENIGMCARAMMNFGLSELRLVAPRDGWPRKGAHTAASGAVKVLETARLFDTVEDAVADLNRVYATTARGRGQAKPVLAADGAAQDMGRLIAAGSRVGVLFGPERVGLSNDHVGLADTIVSFPVSPAFTSVNLAQSVLLVGYEWYKLASGGLPRIGSQLDSQPATREHALAFFDQIEGELDRVGFFFPEEKRSIMTRNLRNIWHRLELSRHDVQTLRGVVQALVTGPRAGRRPTGRRAAEAPSPGAGIPEGE